MGKSEMASEAAGARTRDDTSFKKQRIFSYFCTEYRLKDTKKQPMKRVHSLWSRTRGLYSGSLFRVVKTPRISPAVLPFSADFQESLEPLFWKAHGTAWEAAR